MDETAELRDDLPPEGGEGVYAALTSDLAVELGQEGAPLRLSPEQAIDLGTTLIALGKQAVLAGFPGWPEPAEQRRLLFVSQGEEELQLNVQELVELAERLGEGWRFAWELALAAVDADHGRAEGDDWRLVVGRSRRLELTLALRSWAESNPELSPELERDLSYLSSRELRDRLLSL